MGVDVSLSEEFLDSLEYQWSGEIELGNGVLLSIWWTAWLPWRRRGVKRIVNVYSNYPKVFIK